MGKKIIHKVGDIYFREIVEEDLEPLRVMHNHPATLHMLTDTTVVTPEMQADWFRSLNDSSKSKRYALCIEGSEVILIGMIRFDQIDKINHNMLVGLDVRLDHRGKGLGKKGFHLILDYAFNVLGMHKVSLYTADFNEIAKNMYLSLGFRQEGVFKEHLFRDGKYHDLIAMSLFKRDYVK
jgi:RimJ/RimL family protein N-acetyltransferase